MQATTPETSAGAGQWPLFGWLGLGLIAFFWPLNWLLDGLRTHWGFFPLWLGYILTVEGLTYYRRGRSLLSQHPRAYWTLFAFSAPFWWLFEWFNQRTGYWIYTPVDSFSDFEYAFWCTISFSVVMPAVFSTTELMTTFRWFRQAPPGPRIGRRPRTVAAFFVLGWAMLAVVLLWPAYGAAFLWMGLYFVLDPVNYWRDHPTLLRQTARGDWRLVLSLWAGCLLCGFFWECWNYYSSPKWIYDVPFVDFWHIFEMPLVGYLGYLPFALELYALYALLSAWLPEEWMVFPGEEL